MFKDQVSKNIDELNRVIEEMVQDNIKFKGNFKHIIIPPAAAKVLTNYDEHAQVCCEVLGRNIGIKRATGDYILSTNIDIIAPRRDTLEAAINSLEPNSFYVFSRCDVDLPEILDFHGGECKYSDYDALRNHLISLNKIPNAAKKLEEGDDYSLVNCCGDFQTASKEIWHNIKGFEDRAFMLRGLSEQMVKLFANNSLDFVYIDGNHAYDFVKQDMEMWWPKLKKGGLFCGHDYLDIEWTADGLMENGKNVA